jgi:hypothetical protein
MRSEHGAGGSLGAAMTQRTGVAQLLVVRAGRVQPGRALDEAEAIALKNELCTYILGAADTLPEQQRVAATVRVFWAAFSRY